MLLVDGFISYFIHITIYTKLHFFKKHLCVHVFSWVKYELSELTQMSIFSLITFFCSIILWGSDKLFFFFFGLVIPYLKSYLFYIFRKISTWIWEEFLRENKEMWISSLSNNSFKLICSFYPWCTVSQYYKNKLCFMLGI